MEMLAAILGRIVGVSLSPEMFVAVTGDVWFGTSPRRFFAAFTIAAIGLLLLVITIVSAVRDQSPLDYPPFSALAAVVGLFLWSLIAVGIRGLLRRTATKQI